VAQPVIGGKPLTKSESKQLYSYLLFVILAIDIIAILHLLKEREGVNYAPLPIIIC
jgi:hypothetical protein